MGLARRLALQARPIRPAPSAKTTQARVSGGVEAAATAAAVGEGVWLRPFGRLVYAMPPYVIGEEQLARVCGGMLAAAEASLAA